jgi:hypothetical protein
LVGAVMGSIGLVTPFISSSICLMSMSSVLFTYLMYVGWLAARSAKLLNLRAISL